MTEVASPPVLPPSAETPRPKHVYRWDLDKTYLRTEFDSFRALIRTAFERAEQKQAIPGAAALLRELKRRGETRLCFISGSPRQMRKVLSQKLALDGIEFDEFILKPNLRNLLTGRFRALREQVGYKLPALLSGRAGLPSDVLETCFGDDAEADGFIYSLYGDLIAGRVERAVLDEILERAGVYTDDIARTRSLIESLEPNLASTDAVRRIFIHLDRRSATSRFDRYGARLVPIFNYFQATLVLYEDGQLDAGALFRIVTDMIEGFGYSSDALRNSLHELVRRGRVAAAAVGRLADELGGGAAPSELGRKLATLVCDVRSLPPVLARLPEGPIDYLAALEVDLPRAKKARK